MFDSFCAATFHGQSWTLVWLKRMKKDFYDEKLHDMTMEEINNNAVCYSRTFRIVYNYFYCEIKNMLTHSIIPIQIPVIIQRGGANLHLLN